MIKLGIIALMCLLTVACSTTRPLDDETVDVRVERGFAKLVTATTRDSAYDSNLVPCPLADAKSVTHAAGLPDGARRLLVTASVREPLRLLCTFSYPLPGGTVDLFVDRSATPSLGYVDSAPRKVRSFDGGEILETRKPARSGSSASCGALWRRSAKARFSFVVKIHGEDRLDPTGCRRALVTLTPLLLRTLAAAAP